MRLQYLLELPARVTGWMLCHPFCGARDHSLSALVSPFWTKVQDPVGAVEHIEALLDHPHNSRPKPANAAALLRHEDAATSAAGAFDTDSSGSDATAE